MPSPSSPPPTGVTFRRRKHRTNKENEPVSANSSSLFLNENENMMAATVTKNHPSGRQDELNNNNKQELLLEFKSACKRTSEADFWKKQDSLLLIECVIEASISMPHPPSNSLLLAEHALDILNVCRRLVKNASTMCSSSSSSSNASNNNTKKKKDENTKLVMDSLCVAVHAIRALATVFEEGTKKDAVIKLLYHAIVSLEAIFSRSDDDLLVKARAASYCLAACHALAVFLEDYSVPIPGKNKGKMEVRLSRKQGETVPFFPVPSQRGGEGASGSILLEQLLVIGVQSILAAAKVLASEHWSSDEWKHETRPSSWVGLLSVVDLSSEDIQSSSLMSARQLICDVGIPWISLLASTLSTKETASYCKRAYRVLWDAASRLSVAEPNSAKRCLQLRGDAVLALLCYLPCDVQPKNNALVSVRSAVFESACNSAWTAAALYVRASKSSSDNYLVEFHDMVGAALDSCSTAFCPPFAEYCAYRALHCGRAENARSICRAGECLFQGLPYCFPHSNCCEDKGSSERSFLALYFLVLDVKGRLNSAGNHKTLTELSQASEAVIDQFNKGVLRQRQDQRLATRMMTWFKLLSPLSLHQAVIQAIENFSHDHDFSGDTHILAVAGKILAKCLGPLIHLMIKTSAFSSDKLPHAWDLVTECYVRAAFAFNKVGFACQNSMKEALGEMSSILCSKNSAPPMSCLEKAGKSLFRLGRTQWDDGPCKDASISLLHSLQYFMAHAQGSQQSSLRNLQLSMRWSSLAAMYKSLELANESLISLVMALVFDILETASVPDDRCESDSRLRFVHALASFSKGSVDLASSTEPFISENRRKLIVRLLLSVADRPEVTASSGDLQSARYAFLPHHAIKLLLEGCDQATFSERFKEKSGAPFFLASILHATLTKQAVSSFPGVDTNIFLLEVATTISAILSEIGNFRLAKNCVNELSLNDLEQVCKLAVASASNLPHYEGIDEDNSDFLAIARSLVYAVASVCLVPKSVVLHLDSNHSQSPDDENLRLSFDFISKGCKILSAIGERTQTDWNILLRSVHLAIRINAMNHPNSRTEGCAPLTREARDLVGILTEADSDSNVFAAAKYCAMRTISGLSDDLSLRGDHLDAALMAFLNKQLSLKEDNSTMRTWLATTACLRSSAQSVASVVPVVGNGAFEKAVTAYSDLEALISQITLNIPGTNERHELEAMESKLRGSLEKVKTALLDASSLEDRISLHWIKGSVFAGLAVCMECQGNLEVAISFFRECYGTCRKLMGQVVSYSNTLSRLSHDSWMEFVTLSMYPRALMRMADCLHGLSVTYSRLGDHRKAIGYAESLLGDFGSGLGGLDGKSSLTDLRAFFTANPCENLQEYRLRQIFLYLKAKMLPIDIVCCETNVDGNPSLVPNDMEKLCRLSPESIFDLFEACEVAGEAFGFRSLEEIQHIYRSTRHEIASFLQSRNVTTLLEVVSSQNMLRNQVELAPVAQQVELSEIAFLVSRMADDYSISVSDMTFLRESAESSCLSNMHRARAFYLLGVIALKQARFLGHLEKAWNSENKEEGELLLDAQSHFKASLELLGSSCDAMTRDTMRCLALVSGQVDEQSPFLCVLINASIGRAARRAVVKALTGAKPGATNQVEEEVETLEFLSSFDHVNADATDSLDHFFDTLKIRMPANARFVSLSLCPTGELLASAIEVSQCGRHLRYITEYVSTQGASTGHSSRSIYDQMMQPLDRIVQQNQDQLNHPTAGSQSRNSTDDDNWKRDWWNQRNVLDTELKDLLGYVEGLLLSNEKMRKLLVGEEDSAPISKTNLASRFEAASRELEHTSGDDDPALLRVPELREELMEYGIEMKVLRKMKKAELVELAIKHRRLNNKRSTAAPSSKQQPEPAAKQFVFLILDENLNRFPFESLPCFDGRIVCRLPSLPFALAKFSESFSVSSQGLPSIDPSRVSFVLDPESNLQGTQDRLGPLIESFNDKYGSGRWNGIVGETPSPAFMEQSLTDRNGMLLYFGHGGGQQFMSWKILEKLIGGENNKNRLAKASIVLMGCSSGRLESVNRKGSKTVKKVPIHFEPEGIALSYILAGAPCVVGNLWDVTDRDIDRFATAFLELFFEEGTNRSIAECIAEARSACKLRYLVGCAPVCYGIPVFKGD